MRNRIWTELTQAKFNIEFAALYAEQQRNYLKYFNIGVMVFSTGGIMGWKIWDKIPVIACGIIAIVSLIRLVQPHIIMTEKQIASLDGINKFYFNYYNRLEKLWYDLDQDSIDNESAKNVFFEIKETESEINQIVDETIKTKPRKLIQKAKLYSDQYFARINNI